MDVATKPAKRWKTWIPVLTLLGLAAGFIAKHAFTLPPAELVIQPVPSAKIPALELPERKRALDGQVVDPAGAGVPDALVFLRAGDAPHFTYTDSSGRFRLAALEEGPWRATVLAIGFEPVAKDLVDSGSPQTIQLGTPVGPLPTLPPIARKGLTGVLTSRTGLSVEGCEVLLLPTLPPESLGSPLPRRATAGADGRFEFADLIVGPYQVQVLPAWARGGTWPDLARFSGDDQPLLFSHAGGDSPSVLAIELQTGEVTGKLVDLDGHDLEGALILLSPSSDASRVWPPESTGVDGTFVVKGLPFGKYTVAIRAGSASVQKEAVISAGKTTILEFDPLEVRRSQ
jgi:carboxypeptidase family protein